MTLIYPFRDSALVDVGASQGIADVLGRFRTFAFGLTATEYFRSPRMVLYLVPEPAAPFGAMTRALEAAFPDTPPYGGAFDDIVPHLSVADEDNAELLVTIEADLRPRLPIEAVARRVELVEHAAEGWRLRESFRLTV